MSASRRAEVKVSTEDLRQALQAVYPHRNKVKTGDAQAQHRVRLVFAAGWLFIMACNSSTSGLAKVKLLQDTRDPLNAGVLSPDDGPMIVDLQPRRVPLILQQFQPNKAESAMDQLVEFDINLDPADPFVDMTDVGGLYSEGESVRYPIEQPHESFPDVIGLVGKALERVGESTTGKDLVSDAELLSLFKAAGDAYDAPVQIQATGSAESRGFVVAVGSSFVGTIESRHHDDDGMKRRDRARMDWLALIPSTKLKAV